MHNRNIVEKFCDSYGSGDINTMNSCYDENVCFESPHFGSLKNDRVKFMWQMLHSNNLNKPIIEYYVAKEDGQYATVKMKATYNYRGGKREVKHSVVSRFVVKNGKIVKHTLDFNFWNWASQAMGFKGFLLGWCVFFKESQRKNSNQLLDRYILEQ